jgi:hypothetical protein
MQPDEPSERSIARKQRAQARDRQALIDAELSRFMATLGGRAFIHDLLLRCHVMSTPYSENPYSAYFQMGEQNIGLIVTADLLRVAPEHYQQMMNEANQKDETND